MPPALKHLRTPPIRIPRSGPEFVSIDQYLELLDVVQQMAERLDKIEEGLIDNFPVMQTLLGDDCEMGSNDDDDDVNDDSDQDTTELVDLTGCDISDYDPRVYYV